VESHGSVPELVFPTWTPVFGRRALLAPRGDFDYVFDGSITPRGTDTSGYDVSRYVTSGYRRFGVPTLRGNDASGYRRFGVPTLRGTDASW